ncbi:NrfD/PsrC family molybdoenzyme membrane anchor subunit [Thermanaeromonas sp. C210]|uniref:NrfD/PsrC family molybdoenzyme membrane anchor subunit n=1 Tax=Thermanaeromonas sp. C210 TaxID=2731925 RepID=UPI00155BDE8D|nr:NrfD/PsrC family molybdoenzyme membrane anchor subunit [Thermanaeromonas sp. C210]GFN23629.1 molybdopterin oxidoreductase [Thermanaeromonas sp. C210]
MRRENSVLIAAIFLLVVSLGAWGYQLARGLIVTHMRNPFSWGLYIATFAFFVGIAAGGMIISSSVYLFNVRHLKPFCRISSLCAFASILAAGAIILPDLGRVERIYNLLLHPNFRSPLIWDLIVVGTYLLLTFLSIYFQLLPDWKKEGHGLLVAWTQRLSLDQVEEISRKWSRRISLVGLPVAVLIHTVTAWIFATQASRNWWNSALLAPDFIAKAVASGTGLVLVVSLLVVGREGFDRHRAAFHSLAHITAGALMVHFFFTANELLVRWWWGSPEELSPLHLLFGRYGWLYFLELALPAFTMVYFLTARGKATRTSLLLGSLVVFPGILANRLLLMPAAYNLFPLHLSLPGVEVEGWNYPIALGEFRPDGTIFVDFWSYVPSAVEVAVTLLPFGLVLLTISLMLRWGNFWPEGKAST